MAIFFLKKGMVIFLSRQIWLWDIRETSNSLQHTANYDIGYDTL
jgi:hypothetical protein